MSRMLINFSLFQAGWFSCVLGGAHGLPWIGPLAVAAVVAVHLTFAGRPSREFQLLVMASLMGLVADSLLVVAGWVSYPSGNWIPGFAPYWIIAMWALFATTLNLSMKWMRGRWAIAAIMGAVGGPLSYLAGSRLGAMKFEEPVAALVALSVIWAMAMPLLMLLSVRFDGVSKAQKPEYVQDDWRVSHHA